MQILSLKRGGPCGKIAGLKAFKDRLAGLAEHGLINSPETVLLNLRVAQSLESAVDGVPYVQASVFERVEPKAETLRALASCLLPKAVIGSSSSGIPASRFSEHVSIRSRVLIVHPVNPPYLIPLVGLVPAPWTETSAVDLPIRPGTDHAGIPAVDGALCTEPAAPRIGPALPANYLRPAEMSRRGHRGLANHCGGCRRGYGATASMPKVRQPNRQDQYEGQRTKRVGPPHRPACVQPAGLGALPGNLNRPVCIAPLAPVRMPVFPLPPRLPDHGRRDGNDKRTGDAGKNDEGENLAPPGIKELRANGKGVKVQLGAKQSHGTVAEQCQKEEQGPEETGDDQDAEPLGPPERAEMISTPHTR